VISGILRFHVNSQVSHLTLNVTFLCANYVEFMFMVCMEFMCVAMQGNGAFGMLKNRNSDELVIGWSKLL